MSEKGHPTVLLLPKPYHVNLMQEEAVALAAGRLGSRMDGY